MFALVHFFFTLLLAPLRSKSALEAENAALRQQIIVLRRRVRGRVKLSNADRLFFVWLYRLFPSISRAMLIVRPDTLVRWHRAGFRRYWRWKSRGCVGRPRIDRDLRALIRRMSRRRRPGAPSCATTLPTSLPSISSSYRPSASGCCMASLSSASPAATSFG
jgi:hypothetical protein